MDIKLSNGNTKIGKDTFILNITSATDCPTKKLGICKIAKVCYALQPELRWKPFLLKYRRQQTKQFDSLTAKKISDLIIEEAKKKGKTHIKYLHIHESGDFRNQKDINKVSAIADKLDKANIIVYGYTARKDLNYAKVSNNLILNGAYFMIHNQFNPVHRYSEQAVRCLGDCRFCDLCKKKKGIVIENKFHGVAFNYLKRKENKNVI